jgi:hypothetical protein
MNSYAQSSADFVAAFADLAKRLAEIDVCTHTADIHWGSFGNWTLIAIKRQEAIRFTYDGRDSYITVEASPIRDHSYPNEWEQIVVKGMDNLKNEAMTFAEDFLRKKFTI